MQQQPFAEKYLQHDTPFRSMMPTRRAVLPVSSLAATDNLQGSEFSGQEDVPDLYSVFLLFTRHLSLWLRICCLDGLSARLS